MNPHTKKLNKQYQDLINNHKENLVMAYKICKDNHLKHDLVQDMYIKIFEYIKKEKIKGSLSSGYIYVIIRNAFYDMKNKKEIIIYTDDLRTLDNAEDEDQTLDDRKLMAEMLDKIPYLQREVLIQHQEKSQRQLSRETGVCRDRLRMYKNQALAELKKIAKDYGYEN
tara:strand:- start:8491 stop:8994 length:504 start_codon:yes stop_codon:yes gene_type:complete